MHYNSDAGEFGPYMLSDYTEELASQNGVQSYIGSGIFTLDNLKKKFNEIMSMNVTPSTGTNLLDVTIDTDLNMIDASGNVVEDTDSITAEKYYADKGIDITSEMTLTLLIITQAAQTTPRMTVPTMMVPTTTVPTTTVSTMMVPTMMVPTMIAKNSDNFS